MQNISRFICERGQREFITLRIFLQFWYRRPVWALLRHLAVDFRYDHFRLVLYLNLVNLSQMILHYHLAQIREILQLFFSSFVFSLEFPTDYLPDYLPVYSSEHNFSYFPVGFRTSRTVLGKLSPIIELLRSLVLRIPGSEYSQKA